MRVKHPLLLMSTLILAALLTSLITAQPAVELYYDDGESDWYYSLIEGNEPAAYGVEFDPPTTPWILTAVRLYYSPCNSKREILRIEVWDQDRRVYFSYAINVSHYTGTSGWFIVDVPDLVINFTPFYVVVWLEKWGCVFLGPSIGYDSDRPQGKSYRAGVVGGNVLRYKLDRNVMIRVVGASAEAYTGEPLTPLVFGNLREELSSLAEKTTNLEKSLSSLEKIFQFFLLITAILGTLTLASLTAAVRASRRASRLEGRLRMLEATSRGADVLAARPSSVRAVEARRVQAEARAPVAPSWLVVIDGSNVAYAARDSAGRPQAKNITLAIKWAEERGYTPLVVVDASLKHHIDNPYMLESLRARGVLYEAPARTSADAFIISIAEKHGAIILSNDTFKEYVSEKPWVEKRRFAFMIVGDEIFVVPPSERDEGKA